MPVIREDSIILLKGQIRNDLRKIFYSPEKGVYVVTFNSGKVFYYRPENVQYLIKGEEILMPVRVTRKADGVVFQKILGVKTFVGHTWAGDEVMAYRVVYENGHHADYPASALSIEKHLKGEKAKNVYHYLKELSNFSRIELDEDTTIGLFQKYAKVRMIGERSPLADYLSKKKETIDRVEQANNIDADFLIFPFGCNRSQYKAVKQALTYKLSVIQGPPGTGKTQTILNIVANLIIAGKSIEIVSNNNSAVQNVAEKMAKEKYSMAWLVAYLGKSSNKKLFYESQTGVYPDFSNWKRTDLGMLRKYIKDISARIGKGYEEIEILAQLREKLRQLETQNQYLDDSGESLKRIKRSDDALSLMELINSKMEKKGKLGFFSKLKLRRKGITDPISGLGVLEKRYYELSISELKLKIAKMEKEVSEIAENEERLEEASLNYLHGKLFEIYKPAGKTRTTFTQGEVEIYNTQNFMHEYPVVLSTTFSATTNVNQGIPFDYLIMDEASQVDVSAGALALNAARNAVIVGDEKQLPNVVTTDDKIAADMLFEKYDILSAYDFTTHSFLSSLCELYPRIPKTLLREHYRCSPAIIGFCNKQFYDNSLIAMTREGEGPSLRICSTGEGNFARGVSNLRQAEMIAKEILPELRKNYVDIGIIAPYNEQVRVIASAIKSAGYEDIPVATVHKFQGRENDVIILSTVDNQIKSFVDDPHLLNVAVSRAKKLFVLVVSGNDQPSSNVKDLIQYISYNNGEVFQSSIRSVFDLLYDQMSDRRKNYLAKHRRVSRYDSENLMSALLDDMLKVEKYKKYSVLNNYPLRNLIPSGCDLNEQESVFAHRSWSHIDFLIYDKVTLAPILAIEVDGTSYHFSGSDQSKRDALKDAVLEKIGLQLLRLSTDGSSEREKIESALTSFKIGKDTDPVLREV